MHDIFSCFGCLHMLQHFRTLLHKKSAHIVCMQWPECSVHCQGLNAVYSKTALADLPQCACLRETITIEFKVYDAVKPRQAASLLDAQTLLCMKWSVFEFVAWYGSILLRMLVHDCCEVLFAVLLTVHMCLLR